MSVPSSAISEALDRAFRAALMLTGRADMAENAVLDGIAGLEPSDDVEKALVAKTVECIMRRRADFPNQLKQALALLPQELQRLIALTPIARDCFILRILFGIAPASCASILNLTAPEFDESLYAALQQQSKLEAV